MVLLYLIYYIYKVMDMHNFNKIQLFYFYKDCSIFVSNYYEINDNFVLICLIT